MGIRTPARPYAVVLCAGLGTRMGPEHAATPKCMLEVRGRPVLDYTLTNLARAGVARVGINLFHRAEAIKSYVGDGRRWGLEVEFFEEPSLSGTAGGVRRFRDQALESGECLVHYGDVLTDAPLTPLVELRRTSGLSATVGLHESSTSNSVIRLEHHRVTQFLERPTHREQYGKAWTFSGVACLGPDVLRELSELTPADLPRDVFIPLARTGRLGGLALQGKRWALDTPDRLTKANLELDDDFLRPHPASG